MGAAAAPAAGCVHTCLEQAWMGTAVVEELAARTGLETVAVVVAVDCIGGVAAFAVAVAGMHLADPADLGSKAMVAVVPLENRTPDETKGSSGMATRMATRTAWSVAAVLLGSPAVAGVLRMACR